MSLLTEIICTTTPSSESNEEKDDLLFSMLHAQHANVGTKCFVGSSQL